MHPVAKANGGAAFRAHRPVCGGGRVGDQRLGVAEVVRDVDQLQFVQHLEGPLLGGAFRGVELKGDLYLPSEPGPHPIVVNVHGGYWRRGSRDTFQYWGPYLAARRYAGFTVSYRLTKPGQKTYPGVVHDIRAAVQFVRGRAKDFRLDPGRVALWGNSAGAHLASLVALAGDSPRFAGGDRKSTRLNSTHLTQSRMPSSA